MSYCVVEDEEGVECRLREVDACALVFVEGVEVADGRVICPFFKIFSFASLVDY